MKKLAGRLEIAAGGGLLVTCGHSATVHALAAMSGRRLASGSADNTVRIWDTETGSCVRTLTGHSAEVRALAFCQDRGKRHGA